MDEAFQQITQDRVSFVQFFHDLKEPFKISLFLPIFNENGQQPHQRNLQNSKKDGLFLQRPICRDDGSLFFMQSKSKIKENIKLIQQYQLAQSRINNFPRINLEQEQIYQTIQISQTNNQNRNIARQLLRTARLQFGDQFLNQNFQQRDNNLGNLNQENLNYNQWGDNKSLLICAYYEKYSSQSLENLLTVLPPQAHKVIFVNGITELKEGDRSILHQLVIQSQQFEKLIQHIKETFLFELSIHLINSRTMSDQEALRNQINQYRSSLDGLMINSNLFDLICEIGSKEKLLQIQPYTRFNPPRKRISFRGSDCDRFLSYLKHIIDSLNRICFLGHEINIKNSPLDNLYLVVDSGYSIDDNQSCTYFISNKKSSFRQALRFIYGGIITHFDPDYALIIRSSVDLLTSQAFQDHINILMKRVNQNYAVSWQVTRNFRDFDQSLFNNDWLKAIEHTNQLIQREFTLLDRFKHDPLSCYLNWQEVKIHIEQYCLTIAQSEESLQTANLFYGLNSYLPLLINDNKPRFAYLRLNGYREKFTSDIAHNLEQVRNGLNSKKYSIKYLWDKISHRDTRLPYSTLQITIFSFACLHYTLKYYLDMSTLLYVIFISSYQLFNLDDIKIWTPAIQILVPFASCAFIVIFSIFLLIFPAGHEDLQSVNLSFYARVEEAAEGRILRVGPSQQIDNEQDNRILADQINEPLEIFQERDGILYRSIINQENIITLSQRVQGNNPLAFQVMCFPQQTTIYHYLKKVRLVGLMINLLVIGTFFANISQNFIGDEPAQLLAIISVALVLLQKIFITLVQIFHSNITIDCQFLSTMIWHLIYYIPASMGCKLYSFFHQDRIQQDISLDHAYYDKIFEFTFYACVNMLVLLMQKLLRQQLYSCFILIGLLASFGLEALVSISFELIQFFPQKYSSEIHVTLQENFRSRIDNLNIIQEIARNNTLSISNVGCSQFLQQISQESNTQRRRYNLVIEILNNQEQNQREQNLPHQFYQGNQVPQQDSKRQEQKRQLQKNFSSSLRRTESVVSHDNTAQENNHQNYSLLIRIQERGDENQPMNSS